MHNKDFIIQAVHWDKRDKSFIAILVHSKEGGKLHILTTKIPWPGIEHDQLHQR